MPLFADRAITPAYTLQRSRRRTIAIHVHDDRVEVRAPLKAAKRDIDAFVCQKHDWIQAKLVELEQRSRETLVLRDGQSVSVMGVSLLLQWQASPRPRICQQDDKLVIETPDLDVTKIEKLFKRWLAKEAESNLVPRAQAVIANLGLQERSDGFCLRYTRSLWGRCSASGNILFNPLILLAPIRVIEYLVAHEVCHLQFMNHSPAFWGLVAQICPDWQASRRWLREHGHRLRVK